MARLEFLRSVDGFQSLSDDQLAVIDSFCSEKEFQHGDRLFKDGDVASYLWLVNEGMVDLRFDLPGRETSEENTLLSIRENRIIGWSSLLPPYKYKLSAYCASSRCQTVMIEQKKLLEFLKENPKIGYPVFSAMLRLVGRRFQWLKDSAGDAPLSKTE
jgi:CRP-like cAMP-binding protein